MGLDISVLKNAKLIAAQPDVDNTADAALLDRADVQYIYTLPAYAARLDGNPFGYYSGDGGHSFRAGSYSGYNEWRRQLCKAALGVEPAEVWDAPAAYAGKPFVELIDFADNEGAIGPATSEKLAADFWAQRDKVFAAAATFLLRDDLEWFKQLYGDWTQAFREAAESAGFVEFH